MAEALLREIGGDRFEVYSAGVAPAGIHPMTMRALEEEGIDPSRQRSKPVSEVPLEKMNIVITLCGNAREVCPAIPGGIEREHWPIEDPACGVSTLDERFQRFRETREKIRDRILDFIRRSEKGNR
jgi:arsenate reductase